MNTYRVNQSLPATIIFLRHDQANKYEYGYEDDGVAGEYKTCRAPLDYGRSKRRVRHHSGQRIGAQHNYARQKKAKLNASTVV